MRYLKISMMVLLALMANIAKAQSNDVKALNVSMSLNAPLSCSISIDNDLVLAGTLPASGTAVYTADPEAGNFTVTGSGAAIDNAASTLGQFTVNVSGTNSATLNVIAPPSLSGGGGATVGFSMNWAKDNGGGTFQAVSGTSTTLSSGTHVFRVGGQVSADNSTPPGNYTSSIDISVSCN